MATKYELIANYAQTIIKSLLNEHNYARNKLKEMCL